MGHIAKIFMNGKSQAVRLPKEFRFKGKEVDIRRDPVSGNVVLSEREKSWKEFFAEMRKLGVDKDFMKDRKDLPQQKRDWMYNDPFWNE